MAGAGPTVQEFLEALQGHEEYRQQICHIERYGARPPQCVPFSSLTGPAGEPLLSEAAVAALHRVFGIDHLFAHQHGALAAVLRERRHLCLTTGTSSGKSLAFALPILEAYRQDARSRALIIFPTKALAQDQLGKLQRLFHAVAPNLGVCTFDGDTPKSERLEHLRNCQVFLTNPDMLHYTILANHTRWRSVLENLRYVVLDEAHVYRASFGTHVALLLRRFRRVLEFYRVRPLFIGCSATMLDPGPFLRQLIGLERAEDTCVIDEDTAGRGDRQFCLWNPPLLDPPDGSGDQPAARSKQNAKKRARFAEKEGGGNAPRLPPGVGYKTRCSAYGEAAWVLAEALRRGHRTVCFLQNRSMVELVLQTTNDGLADAPQLQSRLAAYRGGYAAADRRRLEQQLFSGALLGVVATNALELGIDIGDLDMTIHVGMPPTVASVWQQAGRAGRRGRPSVAVLVAQDSPLEQHFCRHAADFFQRKLETRLPDVVNPYILHGHVLCAAVELAPLTEADAVSWFGADVRAVLDECRKEGRLIAQRPQGQAAAAGGEPVFRHCAGKNKRAPKEEVNLRDIDPVQFHVRVRGDAKPLETLDQKLAYMRLHPGAIYLHQRTTFFVEELDLKARTAWVAPQDPKRLDYYTECREHSQVILSGGGEARAATLPEGGGGSAGTAGSMPVVHHAGVGIHWRMYGFRKKAKSDHRILDMVDLSLPAVEYQSRAVWMDLPGPILKPVVDAGRSADRGGLHALEHAMIALAPMACDLEAAELSCQHTRRDSDPNRYLLLLFETQKGGGGTAPKVYAQWEKLLGRAVKLIEECPCDEGCPNCIVIPGCGEYNHGLDKTAALSIGRALGFGAGAKAAPEAPTAAAEAETVSAGGAPCTRHRGDDSTAEQEGQGAQVAPPRTPRRDERHGGG